MRGYDWILVDAANRRNIFLLPSLLTGVGCVAGFRAGSTIPDIPAPDPPENISVIAANLSLLQLFQNTDVPGEVEPEIYFSNDEKVHANQFLEHHRVPSGAVVVAMQTQVKSTEPKLWSEHNFARLADRMVAELRATIIFTGAHRDVPNIQRIRSLMSQPSLLAAGNTTIPQLAALLKRCSLFITLDTGAMHVGRATGVPMVILAADFVPAIVWLPLNNRRHSIIREPIEAITVEEVFLCARHQLAYKGD
jgi:ADP-heptose:LPS heptosyltransferase